MAILMICISVGMAYSFYGVTPKYQSSTTIILANNRSEELGETITQGDITLNQKLVATYTQIIKSNKVLRTVIDNLRLDMSEAALNSSIKVTAVNNTEMLKVSVTDENPVIAALIANEIGQVFSREVTNIYHLDNVTIIDKAEVEQTPCNINHIRDIIIAGFAGMFLSAIFVTAAFFLDDTIKVEEDVESYIGLNVLTNVPLYSKNIRKENKKKNKKKKEKIKVGQKDYRELVVFEDPKSPISEFFRTLRANILFTKPDSKLQTILITSGMQAEGKSWISSNLAVAFAQSNKKVLLVDADMRKGRLHHIFHTKNRPGLSNILTEIEGRMVAEKMEGYLKETDIPNLHIITSGDRPPNPSELVSSAKMQDVLNLWKKMYDIVILDGTPCMMVADSVVLSRSVDTTAIVTESKKTKIDNTNRVKKAILGAGGTIAGIIINKVEISAKTYNDRYYYSDKEKNIENKEAEKIEGKTVKDIIQEFGSKVEDEDETILAPTLDHLQTTKGQNKKGQQADPAKGMYIENYYGNDTKKLDAKMERLACAIDEIQQKLAKQAEKKPTQEALQEMTEKIGEMVASYQEMLEAKLQEKIEDMEQHRQIGEQNQYHSLLAKQREYAETLEKARSEIANVKQMLQQQDTSHYAMQEETVLQELQKAKEQQQEAMQTWMNIKLQEMQDTYRLEQQEIMGAMLEENKKELANQIDSILDQINITPNSTELVQEESSSQDDEILSHIEPSATVKELGKVRGYLQEMNAKTIEKMQKQNQAEEEIEQVEVVEKQEEKENKTIVMEEVKQEPKYKKIEMKVEKKERRGLFGRKEKEVLYGQEVKSEELEETASYVCQILRPEKVS